MKIMVEFVAEKFLFRVMDFKDDMVGSRRYFHFAQQKAPKMNSRKNFNKNR